MSILDFFWKLFPKHSRSMFMVPLKYSSGTSWCDIINNVWDGVVDSLRTLHIFDLRSASRFENSSSKKIILRFDELIIDFSTPRIIIISTVLS